MWLLAILSISSTWAKAPTWCTFDLLNGVSFKYTDNVTLRENEINAANVELRKPNFAEIETLKGIFTYRLLTQNIESSNPAYLLFVFTDVNGHQVLRHTPDSNIPQPIKGLGASTAWVSYGTIPYFNEYGDVTTLSVVHTVFNKRCDFDITNPNKIKKIKSTH